MIYLTQRPWKRTPSFVRLIITKTAFFVWAIFLASIVYSQAPSVTWVKPTGIYTGNCIALTSDNNLVVGGYNYGSAPDYPFLASLTKLSLDGGQLWQRTYTPINSAYTSVIRKAKRGPDGRLYTTGYAKVGEVPGCGGGCVNWNLSLWNANIDQNNGNITSSLMLGSGSYWQIFGNDLDFSTSGNHYVVAGYLHGSNIDFSNYHGFREDGFLVKLDLNNNVVWKRCYGGSEADGFNTAIAVEGGYVAAGSSQSSDGDVALNRGNTDLWVVKTDENGNLLWNKTFGGSGADEARKIIQTADGGYLICGFTNSTNGNVSLPHGSYDAWLLKLDANGNLQWQKTYGGSSSDQFMDVKAIANGHYRLAGVSSSTDGDLAGTTTGGWLLKVDKDTRAIRWQIHGGFSDINEITIDAGNNLYGVSFNNALKVSSDCLPVENNSITPPGTTSFCEKGNPDAITATTPSGGSDPFAFQWQVSTDGTNFSNINGALSADFDPGELTATTYFRRVVLSGACQQSISNVVTITVFKPSVPITIPDGTQSLCPGAKLLLKSSPAPAYQWYKDNVAIQDSTAQTLTVDAVGVYTVKTTTNGCPATSAGISINLYPAPAIPVVTPIAATAFCSGGQVTLLSSATTGNQWLKDGSAVTDSVAQQFTAANGGVYSIRYTDGNGCTATSAGTTVTVYPLPPKATISANGPLSFCPGGSVQLSSSSASGNQWYKDNAPINGATGPAITVSIAGAYTVTYTDGTCASKASAPAVVSLTDCDFPTNPYRITSVDNVTAAGIRGSAFQYAVTIGAATYFSAYENSIQAGPSLWKTNGTKAGTEKIKSFGYNNSTYSVPNRLTAVGSTLFFLADDGVNGAELWKSDGTEEGTVMVKDISDGAASSDLRNFTAVGNLLFFTKGADLWKSDGTEDGTVIVKAGIISSAQTENYFSFAAYHDLLYFNGYDATNGEELWKSDGTELGTEMVKNILAGKPGTQPGRLTVSGGVLYFIGWANSARGGLYLTDGTAAGTMLVKALPYISEGSGLKDLNGTLFFSASGNGSSNTELWKSNGTGDGTVMVKDINPGTSNSSYPESLTAANGWLYFTATTPATGYEMWKSNGTDAGTMLVKELLPGVASGRPYDYFGAANGEVYFRAPVGNINNYELWKTDGTDEGTTLIKEINAGTAGSNPLYFTAIGSKAFFYADDGTHGTEPWVTDGTTDSTYLLKDINTYHVNAGVLTNLTGHNGQVYFVGQAKNGNTVEKQIWKSDGTPSGTQNVTGSLDNPSLANASFANFTSLGSFLYFTANSGLFKTDGVNTTYLNLGASALAKSGNKLFFVSNGLSVTDGTPDQSLLLNSGALSSPLQDVNGTLFFVGYSAANGYELWKTDGTPGGTMLVKDLVAGSGSANITYMENVNGTLFFATPTQLWKTNGTPGGTTMVKNLGWTPQYMKAFNGKLYFVGSSGAGRELWVSDGTDGGTGMLKDINAMGDGLNNYSGPQFTVVGNLLFFVADDGEHGTELWRTDGTANGTVMVKDSYPGSGSSNPNYLTEAAGFLCFTANDSAHGTEIWISSGTSQCTNLVSDILPSTQNNLPDGSNPQNLVSVDGIVYFAATAPYDGWSLFKFNPLLTTTVNTVYNFTGSGNWSDAANWCNNQRPPAVLPAGSEIVVMPAGNGSCVVNTPQTISKGAKLTVAPGASLVVQGNIEQQ